MVDLDNRKLMSMDISTDKVNTLIVLVVSVRFEKGTDCWYALCPITSSNKNSYLAMQY